MDYKINPGLTLALIGFYIIIKEPGPENLEIHVRIPKWLPCTIISQNMFMTGTGSKLCCYFLTYARTSQL